MQDHKIYRFVTLTLLSLCTIFLATIVSFLIYGGIKIKQESTNLTSKVNNFNSQINDINTNLKTLSKDLTAQSSQLKVPTNLPAGL